MKIHLETDQLRVVLDSHGAELISLQNKAGKELLWRAGPEWPRHAPVLFPVIGRLTDDLLRHGGREYTMPQHGFARDNDFTVLETTAHTARLLLRNSPATEALFPFPFCLESRCSLDAGTLELTFILTNTGTGPLPASLGWHPAFHWDPSPGWELQFDDEEAPTIRRVNRNVQLMEAVFPSPVRARALTLSESQFADGAVIFETVKSRTVRYVSPQGPLFELALCDFDQFAVWKQPGANFVCLEPWAGLPALTSHHGGILTSPGQMLLQPGETRKLSCRLTTHPAASSTTTSPM